MLDWPKVCRKCSKDFIAKAPGRGYCYECNPKVERAPGGGRKKKKESIADKHGNNLQGALPEVIGAPAEKLVDHASKTLDRLEAESKAGFLVPIPGNLGIGKNSAGDEVSRRNRPGGGWGSCKHVDKQNGIQGCLAERFSHHVSWCKVHIKYWEDYLAGVRAKKVYEEQIALEAYLEEKLFKFETPQDVINLLSKLTFAIYKGWIKPERVRQVREIAISTLKALHMKDVMDNRKKARASGLDPMSIPTEEATAEQVAEDIELAERSGVEEEEPVKVEEKKNVSPD